MRRYQLRTDHLRTEAAAKSYLPHSVKHVERLKHFGVETYGFFANSSDLRNIVALLSLAGTADPAAGTQEYMQIEAFQRDIQGCDIQQIEHVDGILLCPGEGSSSPDRPHHPGRAGQLARLSQNRA